ncbi:protein-glutamate methylesterase/protein-glutamine glutaminase [Lentibacillus saliphilus]|uniref:protein-glutamate methylesterase/protein-glutamine glutaminase n=1 Tax=Lentibacillus saliphilus TaxID=2737028 RepID=UPI001C30A77F|nr:chemotaxis response regulator protein-glutamate methylesterase [Lentibacillus saliphilus]
MEPIRVLVVDDSAFMRKMITDILTEDDRIEVIGTARNGQDALNKIHTLSPAVITLDVEMPIMDGIATLQHIMAHNPMPVVMLSSDDNAQKTVRAMTNGAVDFIKKPSGAISLNISDIQQDIIERVIGASGAKIPPNEVRDPIMTDQQFVNVSPFKQPDLKTMVAIGTSTGGPNALQHVLTVLPEDFPAPLLIVQHMPARFTKSLADRLNTLSNIRVKEAVHGDIVEKGTAYIAPGDFHMRIRHIGMTHVIELSKHPIDLPHRPSVDVLFKSLATMNNVNKLAVVLTGMGSDGANGLLDIKKQDEHAIILAESEQTAAVYGMPKAAIKTHLVDHVIPLQEIGNTILNLVEHSRGK